MWVLLASKPQFSRDLQVEIVIDVARRDNVSVYVLFPARDNRPGNVMPEHFLLLLCKVVFRIALLSQVKHVLLEVRLLVGVDAISLITFGRYVSISFECLAFFGLGDRGK